MNHLLKSNPKLCHQGHGFFNALRSLFFSTNTLTKPTTSSFYVERETLYDRIKKAEDKDDSVIPVIEKWIEDGRRIFTIDLRKSIKNLNKSSRFGHALEVSQWMVEQRKRGYGEAQIPGDIAIRLDLIWKVHGLEEAEKYFNSLPHWMRYAEVYRSLLKCYVANNHVEKAEAVMQQMREMGSLETHVYNLMVNFYCKMKHHEKVDILMQEMESKGIKGIRFDSHTFNVQLSGYADSSNIEGMEKILRQMKMHPDASIDWKACTIAASGYLKAGLNGKALTMLKEAEPLITGNFRKHAYDVLFSLYADAGSKDDVCRLWNFYTKSKLDDIDGAEIILEEWLLRKNSFSIEIVNAMVNGYSRRGLWEKAEAFVNKALNSGLELDEQAWDLLATGYRIGGQIVKAVEAMKKAMSIRKPGWTPSTYNLGSCLEGLKGQGDVEAAEELLNLVMERCPLRPDLYDKFKTMIGGGNADVGALDQMGGDAQALNGETSEKMEVEEEESDKL